MSISQIKFLPTMQNSECRIQNDSLSETSEEFRVKSEKLPGCGRKREETV